MPPRKSSRPEIGLIGSINRDTIHRADGSRVTSWGGILYNIKFLCESGMVEVKPAANVGDDGFAAASRILEKFPDLDRSLIKRVPEKNNHCFLYYHDQAHKCEILKGGVRPLTYSRLKPLLECDLVLVNFISGGDVELAALEHFRRQYSGLIYMDVHSLTLGRRRVAGGVRRWLRRPRFWDRYARCADFIQVNRKEFEIVSGIAFSPKAARDYWRDELPHTLALIITLGAEGACIIHRKKRQVRTVLVTALRVKTVYDTTGCGDAFAAGFNLAYLSGKDVAVAARDGCRVAASRCRIKGAVF